MGDFNARHSTWWNGQATDEIGRALFDFASSNGLVQLVQGAARHPGGAAAAQLDLMFLNEISCVQACTVLPQLPDHCPTLLSLNVQPLCQQTAHRCFLDFKNADFLGLNNRLSGLDWSSVLDAENSETAARNWHEILSSALQDFIPQSKSLIDHTINRGTRHYFAEFDARGIASTRGQRIWPRTTVFPCYIEK